MRPAPARSVCDEPVFSSDCVPDLGEFWLRIIGIISGPYRQFPKIKTLDQLFLRDNCSAPSVFPASLFLKIAQKK